MGLSELAGFFIGFVSFEELRRQKSEKPPLGRLSAWRAGLFVVSCVVGSVSRQSCVCFHYADDFGAVGTSEITPTWDRGIMPGLGSCRRRRKLPGSFDTQSTARVFVGVEVPERPQHQRRLGFRPMTQRVQGRVRAV